MLSPGNSRQPQAGRRLEWGSIPPVALTTVAWSGRYTGLGTQGSGGAAVVQIRPGPTPRFAVAAITLPDVPAGPGLFTSTEEPLMEVGKYYLFACPWDWTFVGRFAAIRGGEVIIDHAIYFIRTGRRFGELCFGGLKTSGDGKSEYSECGDGINIGEPSQIKKFPWHAATPWKNPSEGK